MESNCILQIFLSKLFTYLTEQDTPTTNETKIFRKHSNNLNSCGDLSFPLNVSAWEKHILHSHERNLPILNYIKKFNKNEITKSDFETLVKESKNWNTIYLERVELSTIKLNLFFNRGDTFKVIVTKILSENAHYGSIHLARRPVNIHTEYVEEKKNDLTSLRLVLLNKLICNILNVCDNLPGTDQTESVFLTTKPIQKNSNNQILCGTVVTNRLGNKNTNISDEQYYK